MLFGERYRPFNILYTMYFSGFIFSFVISVYEEYKEIIILIFVSTFIPLLWLFFEFEYSILILHLMFLGFLVKKGIENMDIKDKIMIAVVTLSHIIYMGFEVSFVLFYWLFVTIYSVALFYYLLTRHSLLKKPIIIKNKIMRYTMLVCSRYSLYLYTFHILILILIKKCFLQI
jgi:hypothetical protein